MNNYNLAKGLSVFIIGLLLLFFGVPLVIIFLSGACPTFFDTLGGQLIFMFGLFFLIVAVIAKSQK